MKIFAAIQLTITWLYILHFLVAHLSAIDDQLKTDGLLPEKGKCELQCRTRYLVSKAFSCNIENHECRVVTRDIMKNARTKNPKFPYLQNASVEENLSITFYASTEILDLEDGFLADYPNLVMLTV